MPRYSLKSFSFVVEQTLFSTLKSKWDDVKYCLLANEIGKFQTIRRQPYVRLTLKSKVTRKETSLSYNLLRDSNHLKLQNVYIKSDVMILKNIWLRCGDYVS